MANDWHSARPAVQSRWESEITPLASTGGQAPAVPAASMQGGGMAAGTAVPGAAGGMNSGAGSLSNGTGGMMNAGSGGGVQMESGQQMAGQNSSLNMVTGLPEDVVVAPTTISEAYLGSLKALLNNNKGNYVVAAFLIGNQSPVTWEGILYEVGNDFITIYQEIRNRYVVCDIYSLKFIEFYDLRGRR